LACRRSCFFNRDHPARFTRQLKPLHAQAEWYAPDKPAPSFLRTWTLYATILRLVRRYVTDPAVRRRCHFELLKSLAHRRRWFRLAIEPLEAIDPLGNRIERSVFGAAASLKRAARRCGVFTLRQAQTDPAAPGRPKSQF
jgi:hypothetical protein